MSSSSQGDGVAEGRTKVEDISIDSQPLATESNESVVPTPTPSAALSSSAANRSATKRTASTHPPPSMAVTIATTIEDITHPQLFPDLLFHTSGCTFVDEPQHDRTDSGTAPTSAQPELVVTKRPASSVYIMNKQREITDTFHRSPYYVLHQPPEDVVRYYDRVSSATSPSVVTVVTEPRTGNATLSHGSRRQRHITPPDVAVLEFMGGYGAMLDSQYFPSELVARPVHHRGATKTPTDGRRRKRPSRNTSPATLSNTNEGNLQREQIGGEMDSVRRKKPRERRGGVADPSNSNLPLAAALVPTAVGSAHHKVIASSSAAHTAVGSHEDQDPNLHPGDDPEEEEVEDYTMNYYESEDESDAGNGEATF